MQYSSSSIIGMRAFVVAVLRVSIYLRAIIDLGAIIII
jgi:hypothetical protein